MQRTNSFPRRKLCDFACRCSAPITSDEYSSTFFHDTFDPVILTLATSTLPLYTIYGLICTRCFNDVRILIFFREEENMMTIARIKQRYGIYIMCLSINYSTWKIQRNWPFHVFYFNNFIDCYILLLYWKCIKLLISNLSVQNLDRIKEYERNKNNNGIWLVFKN